MTAHAVVLGAGIAGLLAAATLAIQATTSPLSNETNYPTAHLHDAAFPRARTCTACCPRDGRR